MSLQTNVEMQRARVAQAGITIPHTTIMVFQTLGFSAALLFAVCLAALPQMCSVLYELPNTHCVCCGAIALTIVLAATALACRYGKYASEEVWLEYTIRELDGREQASLCAKVGIARYLELARTR